MERGDFKWRILIFTVAFLQFLYIYIFFIEPNWIKVDYVKIANPRLSRALSGIKVVQISDLHIQNLGYLEVSLIEKMNEIRPDIIFITGDMLGSREAAPALWNLLSLLDARFHIYAVSGDSDGGIGDLNYARQWDKTNTYLLDSKVIRLNLKGKDDNYFWLVGNPGEEMERELKGIPGNDPVILLNHWPDIAKQSAVAGIDLVLSGHTHGGQVGIPLFWKFFPYAKRSDYMRGFYKVKNTFLYVNRGISSEKGIRFFCRPEITVFEFVPEGAMHYRVLPQDTQ